MAAQCNGALHRHTDCHKFEFFKPPPNPHDSTLHARKFKVNAHWQVRTHTHQHKINSRLEISLQSKKDATSKSRAASLAPSVTVTSHENFTKYIQTDPAYTHTFTVPINHSSFLFRNNDISVVNPSHTNTQCATSQLHDDGLARSTDSSFQKYQDGRRKIWAHKI